MHAANVLEQGVRSQFPGIGAVTTFPIKEDAVWRQLDLRRGRRWIVVVVYPDCFAVWDVSNVKHGFRTDVPDSAYTNADAALEAVVALFNSSFS